MSYEMKYSDVVDFARFIGAETKSKGNELEFKHCPKCNGGSHKDDWTFSINTKTGAFCCQRASCDYKGHFVELCRDFNFPLEVEEPKIYRTLPQPKEKIKPRDPAIEYLKSRGIGERVAKEYEITSKSDDPNILVFYFYNQFGVLKFIKYRDTQFSKDKKEQGAKKEFCEKDCLPILFGMKQCKNFDRLIVTEGQLDSLSVAEAGFDNAVSVPLGCNISNNWFKYCEDWVGQFKEIVVFGDCEHGKITLVDYFVNKYGEKVKVVRQQDYLKEKDANDILQHYGAPAIVKAIENAEHPKIDSVIDISSVEHIDPNSIPVIKTGVWSLDRVIRGLQSGTLTILTGRRGEGKSTFASQIICSALEQGENVFAYSGELSNSNFKDWLYSQLAGTKYMIKEQNEYGDDRYRIDENVVDKIDEWVRGRMFIYDNSYIPPEDKEFESLPDLTERVVKQYGISLVVIDNLMTAMDIVTKQNDLYLAQGNFVHKLKQIAMRNNVAVLLIAHPKKDDGELNNDSVSGSSDITNKADTVLVYSKAKKKISGEDNSEYDNRINVIKNRHNGWLVIGEQEAIKLFFSKDSKRVIDKGHLSKQTYGWEKMDENKQMSFDDDDLPY